MRVTFSYGRGALGRNFRQFLRNFMYGIFTHFSSSNAAVVVALYVFRELRLAAYRDRIAAACTVCTSCYAKYRVRTACTSLLITGDQASRGQNEKQLKCSFLNQYSYSVLRLKRK